MKLFGRALKAAAVATTAILTFAACAAGSPAGAADVALGSDANNPIRIGVVNAEEPYRQVFAEAAQDEGIYIEFVNFSEFPLVNQALADGDLDMNQFQHLQFLANFNVSTGNDLTPIGATAVYPLGLFSLRWESAADIPEGGVIAIPNDPTNQARALLILQDAGLVSLRDGGTTISTPFDIIADESRVTVLPVEAAMTAASLPDVDGSIVNNSMITQIGMGLEDAIFRDDPDNPAAQPYINVWVVRADDADNPTFNRLVELFHTAPGVIDGLMESSAGTAAVRNNSAADLQQILSEIQTNLAANR